jgi:hypothetical protein
MAANAQRIIAHEAGDEAALCSNIALDERLKLRHRVAPCAVRDGDAAGDHESGRGSAGAPIEAFAELSEH